MIKNVFFTKLSDIFDQLNLKILDTKKILVAVSGGSDSLALTLLLKEFCDCHNIKLMAVTIDHQMRQESNNEAKNLQKKLLKLGINHKILISNLKNQPKSNIEANLRQMRYDLLYQYCQENNIKFLFLGHQRDDLAENFLIRLFRGSGIDGLAAISEISDFKEVKLIRPLLDFSKSELEQYLKDQKIAWFEDLSNQDDKFLRNKIRKFLLQLPEHDLIINRIKSTAKQVSESKKIIDDLIIKQAKEILQFKEGGYFLLNYKKLAAIDQNLALKILALVLIEVSGDIYKPRLTKLLNFYHWVIDESLDSRKARNFYGSVAEKYDNNNLILYREKKAINLKNIGFFSPNYWLFDGRLLIDKDFLKNSDNIFLLDAKMLNLLIKKLKNNSLSPLKNPIKKVLYTIPFFDKNIIDFLPLSCGHRAGVRGVNALLGSLPKFYFRTILKKLFDENSK
jgi:tRNA(Ile)-lysidine synthase